MLAGSGKGVAGPRQREERGLLVGVQVIVSCLVLVICGNLVDGACSDEGASRPVSNPRRSRDLDLPDGVRRALCRTADERLRYWDELTAAIESAIPGAGVAYATACPDAAGQRRGRDRASARARRTRAR